MQTGVIDGAMIDATALRAFRLAEVTRYVTTGMASTISSFFLIMNRDSFAALSPEAQKVLLEAGRAAARDGHAAWQAAARAALSAFAAMPEREVIQLAPEEVVKFDAVSAQVTERVIGETEAAGITARTFVEALRGH
jgi:TRAP-type C4-dicarboxylate transport system substrate-binding protein